MAQRDGSGRATKIKIAIAAVFLLGAVGLYVDQQTRPTLVTGPMVQMPAPDTLTIVWEMDAPFGGGAVLLRAPDGDEVIAEAEEDAPRYVARFEGLKRGATYSYTVINHGLLGRRIVVAGPFETATAPPRGKPFRFVAFGDSGNGSLTQESLAQLIAGARPDVVIHTGDLVYTTGAMADYAWNFFEPNAAIIRSTPFMPTLGNHDCATEQGGPLLDVFVLPRNGPKGVVAERNYWFDYGDARFVALDTNLTGDKQSGVLTADEMKTAVAPWLREVLTAGDARWKFVYFHHPFYTGSTHVAEGTAYVKEAYAAVFESCGVDMVFCGHNHLYERTAPILRDEVVDDGRGVVYVTTGAGGVSRYEEKLPTPAYIRAYNDAVFSFTQVDVTADRLALRQIGEDGQVIDEYTLDKKATDSN